MVVVLFYRSLQRASLRNAFGAPYHVAAATRKLVSSELKVVSTVPNRFSTTASHHEHDHSKLWTAERILTTGLLGAVPAAFIFQSPVMDYTLALAITLHAHWGIEAVVVDYVRPAIFGKTIPKVSIAFLYFLSMVAFGSMCYFTYADVGLVQAIKMVWKL